MNMRRLGELPLFAGLDRKVLDSVASTAVETSVEEGRVLVRQGDFAQDLTIIDEGEARVEIDGNAITTLGPGDVYGEAGLLAKEMRNATVIAQTDMRLITLNVFDVNRLRRAHPELVERLTQLAASRG